MERMQQRIRQIAGGDQAKLARLKEILSWFDNEWEISRTVKAMWQCMRKSETSAMRAVMYMYSSAAVTPQSFEFIEYLLWAMEQTNSPEATASGQVGGEGGHWRQLGFPSCRSQERREGCCDGSSCYPQFDLLFCYFSLFFYFFFFFFF